MSLEGIILLIACSLFCVSCSDNTAGLGYSVVPSEDFVETFSNEFTIPSKTIYTPDSILTKTDNTYLGRFTDPVTGVSTTADFITQFNCIDNFEFPDSVYGIEGFDFPDWVDEQMAGKEHFKTRLSFYFTTYFGDPSSPIWFNVRELDTVVDGSKALYQDFNPKDFCNMEAEPLVCATMSTQDYNVSDSVRSTDNYYPCITIALPDSIAEQIVRKYYAAGGKDNFKDAWTFINNICPGYYIEYTGGDGLIFCFDHVILEIGFNHINDEGKLETAYAQFSGNSEVMRMNKFYKSGLETLINDTTCSYVSSPFGLMTEMELPITELINLDTLLNEARITLNCLTDSDDKTTVKPDYLLMMQKDYLDEFFNSHISASYTNMLYAGYNSQYNHYKFNNITSLLQEIYLAREEWFNSNNLEYTPENIGLFESQYPDWNKVIVIPVKAKFDSNSNVVGFVYNDKVSCAKIAGGPNGHSITVNTIHCYYHK